METPQEKKIDVMKKTNLSEFLSYNREFHRMIAI